MLLNFKYSAWFFAIFLFLEAFPASGQKVSILFTGDIMGHDTQIASAENRETHTYNYDTVFTYIKPLLSEPDITISNFEVTLAGPPYKGYPQFSSPAALAVACRNAGIDYLVLANNHAADRGNQGIISTINRLDSIGIPHTGTWKDQASRDSLSPLMIHKNGFNIALLNYTYATNGIRVPKPVLVDSLSRSLIAADIEKAKSKKPDAIILFLHWGTEYDTVPSPEQSSLAKFCITSGADLVIGSHPHVIQRMTWLRDTASKEGVVVYSLGNFVSNQRKPKTDGGSMVRIELEKGESGIRVASAGYYLTWVYTPVIDYRLRFFILPCSVFENNPGFFSKNEEFGQMKRFINDSRMLLKQQNEGIGEYIFSGGSWVKDDLDF